MLKHLQIPRLRFSLRTLMLAVTVFCIWPGTQIYFAPGSDWQSSHFGGLNVSVYYSYQFVRLPDIDGYWNYDKNAQPSVPRWLLNLVGDDFFFDVVEVEFDKDADTGDYDSGTRPVGKSA